MTFRTLDDLVPFEAAASSGSAVVYGGGFNAIDLATSFARRGARVTAVIRGDGYLARVMDPVSRDMIRATLVAHGVDVRTRTELVAVEKQGLNFKAYISDNIAIECGGVAVSLGVDPNIGFLEGSGVSTNVGVRTDEHLMAAPGIFSAGDVAEYFDAHLGAHRIAGNWQNAMFQGKVAGANMAGESLTFDMVTSYSIPCFELPVSVVGAVDVAEAERVVRHAQGVGVVQLIVKRDRVVGATCVGPFSMRAVVTKLIAEEVPMSDAMKRVASDPASDLLTLIP
jgi:NADPH-dependent 2,4-dienoyl-CoA reductase/sulfur reductase-like enzyme